MSTAELLAEGCVSIAEAARFSGLSRSYLYAAMMKGELPFVTRGDRRLIPRNGLLAYLGSGLNAPRKSPFA